MSELEPRRTTKDILNSPRSVIMESCPWGEILGKTDLFPEETINLLGTRCCNIRTLSKNGHQLAKKVEEIIDTDPVAAILWPPSVEHATRYIQAAQILSEKSSGIVLDVGCGPGDGSLLLGRQLPEHSIIGLDSDESVFVQAQKKKTDNVSFLSADAESTNMPVQCDAVIAFEVIEHLQNPQEAIASFARMLKPDGILLLSCPNLRWLPEGCRNTLFNPPLNPNHPNEPTKAELEQWINPHFQYFNILGQGNTPVEWTPYGGLKHLLHVAEQLPLRQKESNETPLLWTHNNLRRILSWTIIDNAIQEIKNNEEPMTFFVIATNPML